MQATWNLLEPSAGEALAEAHARGWGVIIKEGLANGRLTDRNPAPELAPLRVAARRLGTSLDALALAAVLAQPWVDVVLSGAARIDHLHSNLAALKLALEELPAVSESAQDYWGKRSQLEWN